MTLTYTLRQFGGGLTCSSPRIMYSTGTMEMPHLKLRETEGLKREGKNIVVEPEQDWLTKLMTLGW